MSKELNRTDKLTWQGRATNSITPCQKRDPKSQTTAYSFFYLETRFTLGKKYVGYGMMWTNLHNWALNVISILYFFINSSKSPPSHIQQKEGPKTYFLTR